MKNETLAKFACAYSGLVWGLFWIPIRGLASAGIEGLWATLFFYAVPFDKIVAEVGPHQHLAAIR